MKKSLMQPVTATWPGRPFPLGATWDGKGVNFALFSEHAERVELCLFDETGQQGTSTVTTSVPKPAAATRSTSAAMRGVSPGRYAWNQDRGAARATSSS